MPVYLGDKKVSIFAGAGAAKLQEKTVTPTERQQTVTPDTGYDGMSQVTVDAVPAGYIGSGVTKRRRRPIPRKAPTRSLQLGSICPGRKPLKAMPTLLAAIFWQASPSLGWRGPLSSRNSTSVVPSPVLRPAAMAICICRLGANVWQV